MLCMRYVWALAAGCLLAPARLDPSTLPVTGDGARFLLPEEGISLDEAELSFVRQAIQRSGGNQTRAAELLGIDCLNRVWR